MALYPVALPQLLGTEFSASDGQQVSRSVSGRPRIRNYYSQTWREGRIVHELNPTQMTTLFSFYNSFKSDVFTFTYQADNVTYNCQFASAPKAIPKAGGFYDVEVLIIQVS